MVGSSWPKLVRKRPVEIGRAFCRRFGSKRRRCAGTAVVRADRGVVAAQLADAYGVSVPSALDWLVAAACRRAIPPGETVTFLAEFFDLESLERR